MRSSDPPLAATDDWPFLYLRDRTIAPYYLFALAFVLLVAGAATMVASRATGASLAAFSPHFFLLGAAFLLLETRSLTTFSLLFGTTWTVNAMAFAAILVSVLLAIAVNALTRPPRATLYTGLGATLLTGYQALLIVVAAIYAAAYLAGSRVRLFADRRLLAAEPA